ncbi:MAG: hypothetical protein KF768_02835 [Phycisphaeraceae bacterium]|nr:hypothetical protein [Phycisphaeraceae bacterium]
MSLTIALDELEATGWRTLDTSGCMYDGDGRPYPGPRRVADEFASAGFRFGLERIDRFSCVKATWQAVDGSPSGSVVGQTDQEAAVYALAHLRRLLVDSAR